MKTPSKKSAMLLAWDEENRHYKSDKIDLEQRTNIAGQMYDWQVQQIELEGNMGNIPTNKRIYTRCARDLSKAHDATVIAQDGFSETSAQKAEDFHEIAFSALNQAGYKNPLIVIPNTMGKGTEEYIENTNKISRIGLREGIQDARKIIATLLDQNLIQGEGFLISHSLGVLDAEATLPLLNEAGHGAHLFAMMPATIRGAIRPKFIWAVRKKVISAIKSIISGKGLELTLDEHADIMFNGNSKEIREHWLRSNPDSARRFLEYTLSAFRLKPFFDEIWEGIQKANVHMLKAGLDQLLPNGMTAAHVKYLNGIGIPAKLINDEKSNHALNTNMRLENKEKLMVHLNHFFNKQD